MLKKLLKYDLRFIFKYWWIAAAICLSLSIVGGFCLKAFIESLERDLPEIISTSSILLVILSYVAMAAFLVISIILVFIRYYRNFFSDEGYLTFTLPVKIHTQLNSKVISGTILNIATSIVITLGVLGMLVIALWEELFTKEVIQYIADLFKELFNDITVYDIVYMIEALIIGVLAAVFSNLFLFFCITFASTIAKKARVILAIGIYYAINSTVTFILQMFLLFGMDAVGDYLNRIPKAIVPLSVSLIGFGIILFISVLCLILYTLQYRMLDRKLNLA